MLAIPKLINSTPSKRKKTLSGVLNNTVGALNQEDEDISRCIKQISIDDLNFSHKVSKPTHKRRSTYSPVVDTGKSVRLRIQEKAKIVNQNNPPSKILSAFSIQSPIFKKKQDFFGGSVRLQTECFSPNYQKRKQENQRILNSLRLQNQKYQKMFSQNEKYFQENAQVKVPQFSLTGTFSTPNLHENFAYKTAKKSTDRKVLQEIPIFMSSSFIFQESNTEINTCETQVASKSVKISNSTSSSNTSELSVFDFEKIKFLGKGNFGQVNLVRYKFFYFRHKKTNFICAMKQIKKSFVKSQNVAHQISRQIRIHQSLKHLNVIGFYGFFDDSTNIYMMMEYATGGELYKKLKQCYRMPQAETVPIIKNAIEGVKFIHTLGYMHRDLKPENMIFQFGIGKICDLGWAVDCGIDQTRSSFCGTPLYLSPEMVRKENYDKASDVWSIGILTYELMVGKVPFNIWSEYDLKQIVEKEIKFPTDYVDFTDDCMDFISKCLTKDPAKRIKLTQMAAHPFLNRTTEQAGYFSLDIYDSIQDLFDATK